jgi:hypothetical protein
MFIFKIFSVDQYVVFMAILIIFTWFCYYAASLSDRGFFLFERISAVIMAIVAITWIILSIDVSWGLFKFFVKLAIQ